MGNEFSTLTDQNKKSIKCYFAVILHCRKALLEVLHDPQYNGLPLDDKKLYKFFAKKTNRNKIKRLKKKYDLKADQVDGLLLPQNQQTFSNKWDLALICVVIINFTALPPPANGWRRRIDPTDITVAAFVVMGRDEIHYAELAMFLDDVKFNQFFLAMRRVLVGLKYTQISKFDDCTRISKFDDFEYDSVDLFQFLNDVNSILGSDIKNSKEIEHIKTKVLDWFKKDNEKGLLIFNLASLIISF